MEGRQQACLSSLSNELLCHILSFLPLKEVLRMSMLNRKLNSAVKMHLLLCRELDLCQDSISAHMPMGIKDKNLLALLGKCPNLDTIYGLRPLKVDRWRLRKLSSLSIPGIIEALYLCSHLKRIETNNLRLLEAISQYLPQVEIIGVFRNREGVFPPQSNQQLKLSPFLRITCLHLIGVQVPELTVMPELQYLYLQWVSFTRLHPFRAFSAMKLKTFVMRHCIGPALPLRYYSLFIALGLAPELNRLELVRVPLLGGMINRTVEDVLREHGFHNLRKIIIGDCKGIMESDVGQLIIAASPSLESLSIQASLTKDSLFVSLHFARCDFSHVKSLHLGYTDDFPSKDEWSSDTLLRFGLVDIPDVPSSITDSGMKFVSQLFPNVERLTISNCPHIMDPMKWLSEGPSMWESLSCLILERCHCLRLAKFSQFLRTLNNIEVVILKNMFREPPKGCSHVGLSAGTGLGLSSAVVSTQDEHIAVQGHQIEAVQDNENAGEQNANDDDDDDNEDNVENAGGGNFREHRGPGSSRQRRSRLPRPGPSAAGSARAAHCESASGSVRCLRKRKSSNTGEGLRLRSGRSTGPSLQNNDELAQPSCSHGSHSARQSTGQPSNSALGQPACPGPGATRSRSRTTCRQSSSPLTRSKSSRCHSRNVVTNPNPSPEVSDSSHYSVKKRRTQNRAACCDDPSKPSTSKASCCCCRTVRNQASQVGGKCLPSPPKQTYRGPVTRRQKQMMFRRRYLRESCTQSTQTVRRSTSQSLSYRACSLPRSASAPHAGNQTPPGRTRKPSSCKNSAKKPKKCDKATSTSDPLLEEDVTEVFSVVSEKLKSLTIISCGISVLEIQNCANLIHLEAQSCRILKVVYVPGAPLLTRLNISQCPKLGILHFMAEILNAHHENALLIYVNPFPKTYLHNISDIEQHVLLEAVPSQCIAVMHDFSSTSGDRGSSRESLLSLLSTMKEFTSHLLPPPKKHNEESFLYRYPWGHHIDRVIESYQDGSAEFLTNSSLFAALWREYHDPRRECLNIIGSQTEKIQQLAARFSFNVAESVECRERSFDQFIGFYIHMSKDESFE